jgi:hypothetical protein
MLAREKETRSHKDIKLVATIIDRISTEFQSTAIMFSKSLITVLLGATLALATLDPATSNTKGKCPGTYNCSR